MTKDKRRAPRVPATMWVTIRGIDPEPVLVEGNFSIYGIAFERSAAVGEIGTVERLSIAARGGSGAVEVLARVVRKGHTLDPRTPVVAFEFLTSTPTVRAELQALFDRLTAEQNLKPSSPVHDLRLASPEARIYRLNVPCMRIEASWPINVNDKVQLVVQSFQPGGARVPFEGVVTRVSPLSSGRFEADVELGSAGARTAFLVSTGTTQHTITDSIDLVFGTDGFEMLASGDASQHLAGRIDRIPLTSLFAFFELERISGELKLTLGEKTSTLYWSEGQLVDVDSGKSVPPREALKEILGAKSGVFRFIRTNVDRPDRICSPVSALLLDLARQADEDQAALSA